MYLYVWYFELSAMICSYPWLDIHCSHVWYFLVFCTCDPKERKIKSQIIKELLYTGFPKKNVALGISKAMLGDQIFGPTWSKLTQSGPN